MAGIFNVSMVGATGKERKMQFRRNLCVDVGCIAVGCAYAVYATKTGMTVNGIMSIVLAIVASVVLYLTTYTCRYGGPLATISYESLRYSKVPNTTFGENCIPKFSTKTTILCWIFVVLVSIYTFGFPLILGGVLSAIALVGHVWF